MNTAAPLVPAMLGPLQVRANRPICREHYLLTLATDRVLSAAPGQFIHLGPVADGARDGDSSDSAGDPPRPMLRRAFSIAGLRSPGPGTEIDVLYRVVGSATRWMSGLRAGDRVDALGPLGNTFPEPRAEATAMLIAGGVGIPPLLWLARRLSAAGRAVVLLMGAASAELVPVQAAGLEGQRVPSGLPDGVLRLATDDGSIGFHGTVVGAFQAQLADRSVNEEDAVVYTCGPHAMMRAVAEACAARSMRCWACTEQSMACGIGTCQSCVIPVREPVDADGWRYALCCTDGPVFDAADVLWDR